MRVEEVLRCVLASGQPSVHLAGHPDTMSCFAVLLTDNHFEFEGVSIGDRRFALTLENRGHRGHFQCHRPCPSQGGQAALRSRPIANTPESSREADAGCKASVRNHCSPPLGLSLHVRSRHTT
jgi:hypothetical protein